MGSGIDSVKQGKDCSAKARHIVHARTTFRNFNTFTINAAIGNMAWLFTYLFCGNYRMVFGVRPCPSRNQSAVMAADCLRMEHKNVRFLPRLLIALQNKFHSLLAVRHYHAFISTSSMIIPLSSTLPFFITASVKGVQRKFRI